MQSLQKFQYQSAFLELHMSMYKISMSTVLCMKKQVQVNIWKSKCEKSLFP